MILNTAELIQSVRDQLLEFDTNPLTDDAILRRLNHGYAYAYNHIIKSNDAMFAEFDYLTVNGGQSRYPLPRYLHGKRIEQIDFPLPANTTFTPIVYSKLERVDPQSFHRSDLPSVRTMIPQIWTQINNDLWIAPPPSTNSKFRLLITPTLVPLGRLEGVITSVTGAEITLDRAVSAQMVNALSITNANFFSVSCGMTGRLKGVFGFETASGTTITLGRCASRTEAKDKLITQITTLELGLITYDPLTSLLTAEVLSGNGTNFDIGDPLEILQTLAVGTQVNIDEVLTSTDDFYARPEYTVPVLPFTRGGTVTASSAYAISWSDSSYTPQFINGYRGSTGIARSGVVSGCVNYVYQGKPCILLTFTADHNLTLNELYKINVAATGTNCDISGLKVIPISVNTVVVLLAGIVGAYSGAGTWTEYHYSNVVTGTPRYLSCTYGTPVLTSTSAYKNTPYTSINSNIAVSRDPATYRQEDGIRIDDLVTLGVTTGAPIVPESMHELLIHWVVLSMKSAINESDTEVAALLKELMKELAGDNAGRCLGITMEKTSTPAPRRYNRRGR